jgi:hypothetical protein
MPPYQVTKLAGAKVRKQWGAAALWPWCLICARLFAAFELSSPPLALAGAKPRSIDTQVRISSLLNAASASSSRSRLEVQKRPESDHKKCASATYRTIVTSIAERRPFRSGARSKSFPAGRLLSKVMSRSTFYLIADL